MRKALLFACLILPGTFALAQQTYFAYLQTENRQPFYVKMNNQRFSSTASGYVILSNLPGGKHDLQIGFPKNEWGEQSVSMDLEQKDQGYLLKQFGEKGWGLFNLQSFAVVMASGKENPTAKNNTAADAGEFAGMLSDVVKDPGIAKPEDRNLEKKNVPEKPVEKPKDASAETVVKRSQTSTPEGIRIEYTVRNNAKVDTVSILIDDPELRNSDKSGAVTNSVPQPEQDVKPAATTPTPENPPSSGAENLVVATNPACTNLASDADFLKLRKRMAGESETERMLGLAKKAFKDKCYTTEQIRNLSALFLNDEGRYSFFDLSYPFTADPQQFPALQSQLTDTYYISRFKAMLRQ